MPKPCPKVKFATTEAAQFHIDKNKERNDAKGLVARVYLCPCGSYHITSKPTFQETEASWQAKIDALEEDKEALKEQLIKIIQKNEDYKAEIELLKEHLKAKKNQPPIQHLLNKANAKIVEQRKQISTLLNKLNQFK